MSLQGIKVLAKSDNKLVFRKKIFTYVFEFRELTPGLDMVHFTKFLFGVLPFWGFRGEIGTTYKHHFINEVVAHG